jgi:hypothetical protein
MGDRFWQPGYYSFEIYETRKLEEKLTYMHLNPVRAGLVEKAVDWKWSSARAYEEQRPCWSADRVGRVKRAQTSHRCATAVASNRGHPSPVPNRPASSDRGTKRPGRRPRAG